INVASTTTLNAKAFKTGMTDSATTASVYTIQGSTQVPAWQAGSAYVAGNVVSYNNKNYECRQSHTALVGWEPSNVPALWLEYTGTSPVATPVAYFPENAGNVELLTTAVVPVTPWQAGSAYVVGNIVSYNNKNYECRQSHTALAGWEPANVPALWLEYNGSVTPPVETIATPSFNPASGTFNVAQNVTISCSTVDATIRYTTDGTQPTATSTQYNGAINVASNTILKAKAFKTGMTDSLVASATYTFGSIPVTDLPPHILTGYWQNFDNGATCLKISDVPTSYNLIAVAFADATTVPGQVTFNLDSTLSTRLGGYTKQQFIQDITSAKARGQRVIISVGGEKGTVSITNEQAATSFANSVYALMQEYGFDGVDIDLENGINATYMGSALRQLSAIAGTNLIIAMAPQTIDMQNVNSGYFKLALDIKDILTVVNTQFYNSGAMLGQDGGVYSQGTVNFLTALAAIQLENGLRPDQVGLGLPASPSGAGGGYMNPTMVNTALRCLATGAQGGTYIPPRAYPTLRGAMNWSINWDASNNYNFANTVRPTLDSLGI
ncbi:MAG: carbohydrate-binding protein, partial [Oscillospiraceae bacterium]